MGSTIHCVAGDATSIVTAAAITAALGLPMGIDLIVEYAAGFAFGLLIFQSLFMKDMMGGSYLGAMRHSFMPEWLSKAREPGKWLVHCHIPHHTTNDNTELEGGGSLMAVINVT